MIRTERTKVARRMFSRRFPDAEVESKTVENLRGMEGKRVKALYEQLGARHGVSWKGRRYDPGNWDVADNINRAISAANAALYALTTAVVCSLGWLPQLGFVHLDNPLAFVYDIADLYKAETTLPAAFHTLSIDPQADSKKVLTRLKQIFEEQRTVQRLPVDIAHVLDYRSDRKEPKS